MTAFFDENFDVHDPVEVHWSSSTILAIFFAASLVSAVFFGLGYSFGGAGTSKHSLTFNTSPENSTAATPAVQPAKPTPLPVSNQPSPSPSSRTLSIPIRRAPSTPPVASHPLRWPPWLTRKLRCGKKSAPHLPRSMTTRPPAPKPARHHGSSGRHRQSQRCREAGGGVAQEGLSRRNLCGEKRQIPARADWPVQRCVASAGQATSGHGERVPRNSKELIAASGATRASIPAGRRRWIPALHGSALRASRNPQRRSPDASGCAPLRDKSSDCLSASWFLCRKSTPE